MNEQPTNPQAGAEPSSGADAAHFSGVGAGVGGGGSVPPGTAVTPDGRLVDPNATQEQKTYCTLMHLTLLLYAALPVLAIIAPVVMWQVKKNDSKFVDDHGKETVNFHISLMIYGLVIFLVSLPLVPAAGLGLCTSAIGYFLVLGLGTIGMLLASLAANRGEYYRYPACLRFIS